MTAQLGEGNTLAEVARAGWRGHVALGQVA